LCGGTGMWCLRRPGSGIECSCLRACNALHCSRSNCGCDLCCTKRRLLTQDGDTPTLHTNTECASPTFPAVTYVGYPFAHKGTPHPPPVTSHRCTMHTLSFHTHSSLLGVKRAASTHWSAPPAPSAAQGDLHWWVHRREARTHRPTSTGCAGGSSERACS
jgi:hypothetical protein